MVQIGVGIALLIASRLIDRLNRDDPSDQRITHDGATRGVRVPMVRGRRLVDPIHSWIQPGPSIQLQRGSGQPGAGKGLGGADTGGRSFEEYGEHVIHMGPVAKLWGIEGNGKKIWEGPITPLDTPSGSIVDVGVEGFFQMFWGDTDQPICSTTQNASNHGLSSRFPLACRVVWKKKLGQTPVWPRLRYDIEAHPYFTRLTTSPFIPIELDDNLPAWGCFSTPAIQTLPQTCLLGDYWGNELVVSGKQFPADRVAVQILNTFIGNPDNPTEDSWIKITDVAAAFNNSAAPQGHNMAKLFKSNVIKLSGSGKDINQQHTIGDFRNPQINYSSNNLYFFIKRITYDKNEVFTDPANINRNWRGINTIHIGSTCTLPIKNPTVGIPAGLIASAIGSNDAGGINPAHIIDEAMFARFPFGRSLRQDKFDFGSLEALAALCMQEKLRANIDIKDGETAQQLLTDIFRDVGVMLPWDINLGKTIFLPVRPSTVDLPVLEDVHSLAPMPEEELPDEDKLVNRPSFMFQDKANNYRPMPIQINDDGSATISESVNTENIDIRIATDEECATIIARRRVAEPLSLPISINKVAGRAARLLRPGDSFIDPNFSMPLLVMTHEPQPLTQEVKMGCVVNTYTLPIYGEHDGPLDVLEYGGGGNKADRPDPDIVFGVHEVPRLLSGGKLRVMVPRIRSTKQILGAGILFSKDDTTYSVIMRDTTMWTGALLQADMPNDTASYMAEDSDDDPLVVPLGPDFDIIENLSGDEASWMAGRQIAIIDNELFFLRNVENMGDGTYRLRGLVRNRLGSVKAAHVASSTVFIGFAIDVIQVSDLFLAPGEDLFVKTQPYTQAASTNLADTPPVDLSLVGLGIRPFAPSALRVSTMDDAYPTGADISLRWCYGSAASPYSGFGMQGLGTGTAQAPVQGQFVLEVLTTGDVVKLTDTLDAPSFSLSNDALIAAFGSEPASFKVRVSCIENGYTSDPAVITIAKL